MVRSACGERRRDIECGGWVWRWACCLQPEKQPQPGKGGAWGGEGGYQEHNGCCIVVERGWLVLLVHQSILAKGGKRDGPQPPEETACVPHPAKPMPGQGRARRRV